MRFVILNGLANFSLDDPEIATRSASTNWPFHAVECSELMDVRTSRSISSIFMGPRRRRNVRLNLLLQHVAWRTRTRFIQLYHRDWDHHGR